MQMDLNILRIRVLDLSVFVEAFVEYVDYILWKCFLTPCTQGTDQNIWHINQLPAPFIGYINFYVKDLNKLWWWEAWILIM